MKKPDRLNVPVLAVLEHWKTKNKRYALLQAVNEDDCDWRLAYDNDELSYDWNVISWKYLDLLEVN